MKTILIVEDEADILETVELYLRSDGYKTECERTGTRALELWRAAQPDLLVLDIGLPQLDGLEVLRRVRAESALPIVMLTARAEEVDELLGLGLGADDYLTKPFSPRVLLARVKAVLRRLEAAEDSDAPLRVGPLEVDPYRVAVTAHGQLVPLTPTEFKLLHYLARTPERAVSRLELFEAALPASDALERAVDIHIKNLRAKLAAAGADGLIETVRGVGYRLASRT